MYISDRYRDPAWTIERAISELSFRDYLVSYSSFIEVFANICRKRLLIFCDIFFSDYHFLFYWFRKIRLPRSIVSCKWVIVRIISEVPKESDPISLFEALFALIAPCWAIDIQMCLFGVTILVTVVKNAVCHDLFARFVVIYPFVSEIRFYSSGCHSNMGE
jgi:hypothetical protein